MARVRTSLRLKRTIDRKVDSLQQAHKRQASIPTYQIIRLDLDRTSVVQ